MVHQQEHYDRRPERDDSGKNALGITAIALLVIGFAFLAYLMIFKPQEPNRLEVTNFELAPQESVGESAVREAPSESPTVINLPDPTFEMPAADNSNDAAQPAENTASNTDNGFKTSVKTDNADVNVGVN